MHLVGFIIRIYHDVRSSECQKLIVYVSQSVHISVFKDEEAGPLLGNPNKIEPKM